METDIEPSFLCIGPYNLAVGMNNRIWFYDLDNGKDEDVLSPVLKLPRILTDREYLGNVTNVCLNAEYASVLFEGKIHLHQVGGLMFSKSSIFFFINAENYYPVANGPVAKRPKIISF